MELQRLYTSLSNSVWKNRETKQLYYFNKRNIIIFTPGKGSSGTMNYNLNLGKDNSSLFMSFGGGTYNTKLIIDKSLSLVPVEQGAATLDLIRIA